MPKFPASPILRNEIMINTISVDSIGVPLNASSPSISASTAWPLANQAMYVPVEITYPIVIDRMAVNNGSAVAGNIDVGIYTPDGKRLASWGGSLQSGTSSIQIFNIGDTPLNPGLYYMGVAMSNITGTLAGWGVVAIDIRPLGVFQQNAAYPLPATATFVAISGTFTPLISMTPKADL